MRIFRTPRFLRSIFPGRTWGFSVCESKIFLTFDDGPEPSVTPWILDELKKYNAHATFFCVGEQVKKYPELIERIKTEGHAIGNHTMRHENGVRTNTASYLNSVKEANNYIESDLFRPPYGRLTMRQSVLLRRMRYRVIMWTWLSYDFDGKLSDEQILSRVKEVKPGDILVFHDNVKCSERLRRMLPVILESFQRKGIQLEAIR